MRKLLLLFLFSPLVLMSQEKFGFFSYNAVLDSLPQYKVAMESYDMLKQRCLKEIDHNEQELTRFYVAFLDGHRDFPEPILRKRQKELQQLIDNSIAFRDELKAWLRHAKDSLTASSRLLVDSALVRVCTELSLSYVIDTDNGGYRYINPLFGEDVTKDIVSAIIFPELPLRNVVECPEVATDSIMEIPATELPATEMDIITIENSVEETEKTEIFETEQIIETVLNKDEEVIDSINNK
jgi:outer membrane protein